MSERPKTAPASTRMVPLAGPAKVAAEPEKLAAYLRGEPVFPTCLELDLTTACTRACPECPSTTAPVQKTLGERALDRLLGLLEARTPGLLLTGGEPTLAPLFPSAVARARQRGFAEVSVVTNGSRLDEPEVLTALLAHVTTIRVSLYDWTDGKGVAGTGATLRRIEALRERIEEEGSPLRVGVSALTSSARVPLLSELARAVRDAGAHWLYFHPLCRSWGQGTPELADQDGVPETIAGLAASLDGGFHVSACDERYECDEPRFDGYHAAHFLLVVGADGHNYLAPEVKYQPPHIIADLGSPAVEPLHRPERFARIRAVRSQEYPARGSRHRGILYSDWIQRRLEGVVAEPPSTFRFPFIL